MGARRMPSRVGLEGAILTFAWNFRAAPSRARFSRRGAKARAVSVSADY
jgi:hypothetical protein